MPPSKVHTPKRCLWATSPILSDYHDKEWGVPLYDDDKLFEFLVLDAMQAGLSWEIILKKRTGFRNAFDNFDAKLITKYNKKKIDQLMQDQGIIRNRLKIESTVKNARAFLSAQEELGSFHSLIWQFVDGETIVNKWRNHKDIPAKTKESDALSKELKRRGFSFVGSTICYAFMQAAGLVNDHLVQCFRYKEL